MRATAHAAPVLSFPAAEAEITIDRIGSAGDGMAVLPDGRPAHVARTLPGEIIRIGTTPGAARTTRAVLSRIVQASSERVAPPCPHFATCGGCALQHWDDAAYADWKRGLVVTALQRAGFATPNIGPLIRTPPRSRRRIDLAAQRIEGGLLLGLHRIASHDIVDMHVCEIMHPAVFALVAPLRRVLAGLAAIRRTASVLINLLDNGPDLLIRTDGPLAPTDRAKLAAFAAAQQVRRISWSLGEGIAESAATLAAPVIHFAGREVEPPPGAFLQASAEGEAAIAAAVLDGLPAKLTGKSRAVELFAGCGTISFPLAERLRVVAYEGDALAAAAMRRALSGTRVEITHRDLARQPLSAKELSGAAAIVLDPPYTGAPLQMPAIAASGAPRVIYVSCNPAMLSRDAASLAQAGYTLVQATPIDQFLWSAHVETVAVFEKR